MIGSHQTAIEYDGRFANGRWLVLCSCGFTRRATSQLSAEETSAFHKHQNGECYASFVDELQFLVETWKPAFPQHAGELERILENHGLTRTKQRR